MNKTEKTEVIVDSSGGNTLDIQQIRMHLPHRYPFLLVDRVVSYHIGRELVAIKNISINEECFQGHFPRHPVFPGVLILESMVQSAAILASLGVDVPEKNVVFLFAAADKVRFRRQVFPGDQMVHRVQLVRELRKIWKCAVATKVEDKICCQAELLFTYQEANDF